MLITDSIRKSINQIDAFLDGWTFGRLVIKPEGVSLQVEDGSLLPVPAGCILEVMNGDEWQRLTPADLTMTTREGWPLYAGLEARMKQ
jgi:hypothetical protein